MLIKTDWSILRTTKWNDYAVRFFLGGTITVVAGLIAKEFGPVIGGLFLAFPAIFPATATLSEKREKERKSRKGLSGEKRGRQVAAAEAAGTAMGCVGLMAFALIFWREVPSWRLWLLFPTAVIVWAATAAAIWFARKRLRLRPKKIPS